jgi:transposase
MAALELVGHLSIEELGQRYRAARDPGERSHLQLVWLWRHGRSGPEVARIMGYSERWVAEIVRRYNEDGPAGLGDRRHGNPGTKPLLDAVQCEALVRALQGVPPEGGLWSGPKVAAWIAAETGQEVHAQRGWDYLIKLGFTLKRPRPRHAKADALAQAAFKKARTAKLAGKVGARSRSGRLAGRDGSGSAGHGIGAAVRGRGGPRATGADQPGRDRAPRDGGAQ